MYNQQDSISNKRQELSLEGRLGLCKLIVESINNKTKRFGTLHVKCPETTFVGNCSNINTNDLTDLISNMNVIKT